MPSDENYYHVRSKNNVVDRLGTNNLVSRRRIPFETSSNHFSSSIPMKNSSSKVDFHSKRNPRREIFLEKSSSSSLLDDEQRKAENLDETLNENQFDRGTSSKNGFHRSTIDDLFQSNIDLKKELRDIRRQIKQNETKTVHDDRVPSPRKFSSKKQINSIGDQSHNCSFVHGDELFQSESSSTLNKMKKYKNEAEIYKQQLDACQETIAQLRKTIDTMEKNLEQLRSSQRRQNANSSNQQENGNHSDHRFIHELFHLSIKNFPRSSKSPTVVPSHNDMKSFIRKTFDELIKVSSNCKLNESPQNDSNHFVCKCAERSKTEHRPSNQFSLTIIEQCQSLFDISCYTQLPTALNELYYRYGELLNFKRSIASTLGLTTNSRSVSCPKLIRTLQQLVEDSRSNELVAFKKMAKINDMNEAVSKIRSYDEFVPFYHKFIEQMASLLEVSKGDEILPAIKTLKLLAHNDSHREGSLVSQPVSQNLTRTSSVDFYKTLRKENPLDPNPFVSKSMQLSASRTSSDPLIDIKLDLSEKLNENSETTTLRPTERTDS